LSCRGGPTAAVVPSLALLLVWGTACSNEPDWTHGPGLFGLPLSRGVDWRVCGNTRSADGAFESDSSSFLAVWVRSNVADDDYRVRAYLELLGDRMRLSGGTNQTVRVDHAFDAECSADSSGFMAFAVDISDEAVPAGGEAVQGTVRIEAEAPVDLRSSHGGDLEWFSLVHEPFQVMVVSEGDRDLNLSAAVEDDNNADGVLQPGETGTMSFTLEATDLVEGFSGSIWTDDEWLWLDLPTDGGELAVPTRDLDPDYGLPLSAPFVLSSSAPAGHRVTIYVTGEDEGGRPYEGRTSLEVGAPGAQLEPYRLLFRDATEHVAEAGFNALRVQVTNVGDVGSGVVEVELDSDDSAFTMVTPCGCDESSSGIAPGSSWASDVIEFMLSDAVPADHTTRLTVTMTEELGGSNTVVLGMRADWPVLPLYTRGLAVEELTGDGDERPDPGERVRLTASIYGATDAPSGWEVAAVVDDDRLLVESPPRSPTALGGGSVEAVTFDLFIPGTMPEGPTGVWLELTDSGVPGGLVWVPIEVGG